MRKARMIMALVLAFIIVFSTPLSALAAAPIMKESVQPDIMIAAGTNRAGYICSFTFSGFQAESIPDVRTIMPGDFQITGTDSKVYTCYYLDGEGFRLNVVPFKPSVGGYSIAYTGNLPLTLGFSDADVDETVLAAITPPEVASKVIELTDPLHLGPNIVRDSGSPTGYTAKFLYRNDAAQSVRFQSDMGLQSETLNNTSFTASSPRDYAPGMIRAASWSEEMVQLTEGPWKDYWYIEMPVAGGINQYWFNVDGNTTIWYPDPANPALWGPSRYPYIDENGLGTYTGGLEAGRRAYNFFYVPYDPVQDQVEEGVELLSKGLYESRAKYETPRTDGQVGTVTWEVVEGEDMTRYIGVYLPYGYDADREEPYKTIYYNMALDHDEGDAFGVGSAQHIMDNMVVEGLAEPAVIITVNSNKIIDDSGTFKGLYESIIPYVETNFNVSTKASDRALAGVNYDQPALINYDAAGFGYHMFFSYLLGNHIQDAVNVEVPRYYFVAGRTDYIRFTETNWGTLPDTNAQYIYDQESLFGGHNFNTWNQAIVRFYQKLWKPEMFIRKEGPAVIKDPSSPTGYTGRFVYKDEDADQVYFCGDLMLSDHTDLSDRNAYTPFEYRPGLMRRGGSQFKEPMAKGPDGYWYYEVPLAAGANQYWFNIDDGTRMMPDPANHPQWSPGSNWNTKNAYNALWVPYDPVQDYEPLAARVVENPRTDEKTGTWSYVPITTADTQRYLGVYLPYGYDVDRAEPYKTIYMLHGGGQDESDWMGIGSVQNIMDNLLADGLIEPAIVVTMASAALGSAANGYTYLYNDILPFVEDNYNVSDKADDRSFAGLSAGGGTTASLINVDALAFGYFGIFSSGGLGTHIVQGDNIDVPNIFISTGLYENDPPMNRHDFALAFMKQLDNFNAKYKYERFAGAHDFNTWNQSFTTYVRDYLWKPEAFKKVIKEGPTVVEDPDSPTGYTGQFVYKDETAEQVWFCGDLMLSNHADPSATTVYTPFEYKPGLMRRGGSQFKEPMAKGPDGYWYYEVPLAAGANQYWFNIDNGTRMMPDPANHPQWSPNSNWNTKNAYNALYVPYDPVQDYEPLAARVVENPRTDEKVGTWSYVPVDVPGYATPRYMGVYLPYGYDENRAEPYKLIYMLHGMGQDESDWMGIGSVQNILDNLIEAGETEPAVLVSLGSAYFGTAAADNVYPNLFNVILPFVEENYNVSDKAADRSFAGLSMGAMNSSTMIRYGKAANFGYWGLFSGAQIANIIQGQDLDVPFMLIGDGLYEGGQSAANLNNLTNTGARYDYLRVAGAHDFNTWCQLFTIYARDYLWKMEKSSREPVVRNPNSYTVKNDGDPLWLGPNIFKDPDSPTGYTVVFCYDDPTAQSVTFLGDMMLCDWSDSADLTTDVRADRVDARIYSPWEYRPGMMRRGGTVGMAGRPAVNYSVAMEKDPDTGWWITEVPLAAGANQYWFNKRDADGTNITRMLPDPANMPIWSPGSNWNTKNAYNAVYVPYDAKQNFKPLEGRAKYEIPRTDGQEGILSWDEVEISGTTRYLGVYTPYGYDPKRAEPYKTIYMLHGGGQDESDWVGIGSVQHIMDNLLAEGSAEPALIVTMSSAALGNAANGFSGLLEGIIPYMEADYNVSTQAIDRSFGGLSMGSSITSQIVNYDASLMGYWCMFSFSTGNDIINANNLDKAHYYFCDGGYEQNLGKDAGNLRFTDAKYVTAEFAGAHDFNTWNQAFTDYVKNYLWKSDDFGKVERPEVSYQVLQPGDPLHKGPNIIQDPASPTGYTVKFFYEDVTGIAEIVYFNGDLSLRDGKDLTSTTNYTPEQFEPGFVRVGNSAYQRAMRKIDDPDEFGAEFVGLWYHEMPLAGGANQYWFYHNSASGGSTGLGTAKWYPDPNNMPIWNPATVDVSVHINGIKRAYNSIYVPYDEKQASPILEARAAVENPGTGIEKGTLRWERVTNAVTTYGTSVYVSVYTPPGYDRTREEPYKTVYMTPATDQNESDWFGIGSAQNIMDNLIADGKVEPMVIVSVSMRAEVIGGRANGFNNLFKYVIPYIENTYNVSKKAADRAIGGHYTTSTDLLHTNFALDFGYFSMFSNSSGNLISDSPNVQVPRYYFCNGYTEGVLAMNLLDATNAMYVYDRPTGGHNFNAWNQGLASYFEKLWKPELWVRKEGPTVIKDPSSPTGYTGRFVYKDETADQVYFCGDLMLSDHTDLSDRNAYTPFEYRPGLMRRGGSQFKEPMAKGENGYWYYEVPLAAGANQYWFNVDNGTRMLPDPENHPQWSPNSNWNTKNAYNALWVPYDPVQDYEPLAARVVENPRTDGKTGTWSYVPFEIGDATHYLGVYLPYGYDPDRAEPYKTIYMQHGGGQDESDWMGIGSVQNIMDNLLADGLTEPAIVVTTGSQYLGNAAEGYPNLFNIILPFIEANYNVSDKAVDRSFAGLSMGGMITTNIINYDATKFGYYGVFSGGGGSSIANAKNLGSVYILFGNGLYEGGNGGLTPTDMSPLEGTGANYKYLRFAGAHDFNTWCQLFTTYVRDYLWKPEAFAAITSTIKTIVAGYAANLPANVVFTGASASFELGLYAPDGKLLRTINVSENGRYMFRIEASEAVAGVYTIKAVGAADGVSIDCVAQPEDLWAPVVTVDGNTITITFASEVTFNDAKKSVKIGGAAVANSRVSVSGKVVTITGVTVVEGQQIVISGVKYADLFPSYSFTFTLSIP